MSTFLGTLSREPSLLGRLSEILWALLNAAPLQVLKYSAVIDYTERIARESISKVILFQK